MHASDYRIVHDEPTFIAVNKPAGMPTQADPSGDNSLNRLLARDLGGEVFVVHRLDRPASGLVLFARTRAMAAHLSELLRDHRIERIYWAIVNRSLEPSEATLSHLIHIDARRNKSYVTADHGKPALLHYTTIGESDRYAMLEVRLETGRHHQIRAQLQAIGYPIKGDVKYGARRSQRGGGIGLHSAGVSFRHPETGSLLRLFSPPPDEALWNALSHSIKGHSSRVNSPDSEST